ncbi:MAG: hypothetical protein BWK77_07180 [Verrucomicrobia bacterium A1]|nr:MAG: hypothetical protein BWK77_07180 [Verrucomicrobia bacterium A1]
MSDPLKQKTYQPCGDLWIEQPAGTVVDNYRRWLDLDAAVCVSDYRVGDVTYTREAFASHPARAIVARLRADKPGRVDCRVRLSSVHRDAAATVGGGGRITLRGQVEEGGIRFEAVAQVEAKGGTVTADGDAVRVTGADEVVVRLVAATNFRTWQDISGDPSARCADLMKAALAQPFGALLAAHQADHRALFRRVAIDLGRKPAAEKPTDERIAAFRGGDDPHLAALVFQYGRYLLIGASRAGGQPANLQGIWNDLLKPTWDSKYTCNINTEMNYWPALSANLAECQTPLFDALDDLAVSGVVTAKEHYGAHGWVVHHNFDLWRGSAPINAAFHGDDPLVHRRPPGRPSRRDDGDLRHETRCRGRSRCGPAQGAVARNGERRPEESVKSHKDDFVAQSEAASRLQRRVHAAYTNAIATTRCAAGGHPGARGAPKAKWAERTLLGKPGKGGAMLRFVAFLRGVNPMNAKMVELKRCFEGAGFTDVKTVLSSGNVVFNARAAPEAVLERKAEATMAKQLGRTFHTIMRPADVLHELIEADPYATFRLPVNAKRVVTFLREPHTGKLSLPIEVDGACILAMNGREIFTAYVPNPRGPVFMTLIEKAFGTKVTTRTWDTVKKCATA